MEQCSMIGRELKGILAELGITQADFSRLICVTSRAITLWISGERPVPGPVESYLRLLHSLPFTSRQIEINRAREGRSGMRDGMFAITFQGQQSVGVGVLIFE